MTLYCATKNLGKLREFRLAADVIQPGRFTIEPLPGLEAIDACEETGDTFEANAIEKARHYGARTGGWLFVDDSGLEVDALGGAPGVYSARYAGEHAGDDANNRLLLERLAGADSRVARFVCVIALARAGNVVATFRGTVEGRILHAPTGAGGFGYDPLFLYPPFGQTLAEIPAEKKMGVSHRGEALRAMARWVGEREGLG